MKKFYILIFLFYSHLLSAQGLPDSIYTKYKNETRNAQKGKILRDYFSKAAVKDAAECLKMIGNTKIMFLDQKDKLGSEFMTVILGANYWRVGDYNSAIQTSLNVLPQLEERKDSFAILNALNTIAISSSGVENFDQSIEYLKKALPYSIGLKDSNGNVTLLNNLADNYIKKKIKDSALYYVQQANILAEKGNKSFLSSLVYCTMGEVYMMSKDYAIAKSFMYKSIYYAEIDEDSSTIAYNYCNIAECHFYLNEVDSAIQYARMGYKYAYPYYKAEMLKASEWLYKSYQKKNEKDSVYVYFYQTMSLKDSLYSLEKMKNIEQLNFFEQIRDQEKIALDYQQKLDRKNNLQLTAIAIFILTFFIFIFLFKRKKPNARTIEYVGILAVLLLFEFVSMLLHPMIEHITHHNPFLMLLCLVCIGAVIAPLHHKMTHIVKTKLVAKKQH